MTSSHQPKKSLGQNFLHERVYIERIVQAVDPRPGDRLVEIGPGQGAITLPLLRRHGALTVIEFDRDLVGPLAAMAEGVGELTIVHRDVLSVDFTALAAGTPIKLCGNLPYNISSPILFHALDHAPSIRDMVFMLQKEVVDRMGAGPGSKVYGRLSVMLQAYCQVQPLFVVPPGAFRPAPKVDSAVVRLIPRDPATVGIDDPARYAPADTVYKDNLRRFVREVRERGATPWLATPVVCRKFDAAGKLVETHGAYPDAMRAVAAELKVPLIDMHQASRGFVQQLGDEASRPLFMWIKPGEYAMYPEGKQDDTHFTGPGALAMAMLAAQAMQAQGLTTAGWLKEAAR